MTESTAPFGLTDVHQDGTAVEEAVLALDDELAGRLREQARRLGVSAATVFHTVWARVVAVASGRDDVVFGTVLFGRMQSGAGQDRVPGLFINTLPARVPTGRVGVAEAVRRMQEQLADLLVHEHAPLALAQRASGVTGRIPLFTSLLNYRHTPAADPGTQAAPAGVDLLHGQERTNYPLTVSIDDTGTGFRFTVQAAAPVDPQMVCALLRTTTDNLVTALETVPHTTLDHIEVLDAVERQRLLTEWNDTGREVPQATLPELFQAQVARTPEATAVVFEDTCLSYGELNGRANRLARLLIARGVGPESLVAVVMERSADLVVALLAVVKAGGAYLPVDPGYPADRISYLLTDAAPVLALTDQASAAKVTGAGLPALPVLVLDDPALAAELAGLDGADVTDAERPAALARTASGVCDLHLRFHRASQGCGDWAPQPGELPGTVLAGLPGCGRRQPAARLDILRRGRDRALRCAHLRRPGACGGHGRAPARGDGCGTVHLPQGHPEPSVPHGGAAGQLRTDRRR